MSKLMRRQEQRPVLTGACLRGEPTIAWTASGEKSTETELRGPEGQLECRLAPGAAGSICSEADLLSKGCLGVPQSSHFPNLPNVHFLLKKRHR